jgi:hypothetical protein
MNLRTQAEAERASADKNAMEAKRQQELLLECREQLKVKK